MPYNILRNLEKFTILGLSAFVCSAVCLPAACHGAPAWELQAQGSSEPAGDAGDKEDAAKPAEAEAAKPEKPEGSAASFADYLQGKFAERQGDANHAIQYLRDSLKRDPNNQDVLKSLYRMLVFSGQIDEAVPLAHKLEGVKVISEDEGEEFAPQMLLAVEEVKNGQFKEAEAHIAAIPQPRGPSLQVSLLHAWLKLGMGKVTEPIEAKTMTPEGHVIYPHVYLNAALINDIAGFDKEARIQYEAAVKDPKIEPFRAVEALANFYARKGMDDKRKELVDGFLAEHGDTYLADEILLTPPGDHPQPLVSDAKQGVAEVFYTMANIFQGVSAPGDEIATLHLSLYLRPNYPPAQFLLAGGYEFGQEFKQAADIYKAIDKHSPYSFRGRIRAVYGEIQMGQKDTALSELDALIKERPKEIEALVAKGDILREEKHYPEAIDAYNSAAERVPNPEKRHWIIYFARGACYQLMGQWGKAEEDMKKALALDPSEPEVLNYLGYTWLTMRKDIPKAKKMVEDAYDARPEDAHIIDSMGYALYVTGDYAGAEEYFDQALERTPNDPTVNDHLGDTYWQLGRKTEARYQWERALKDSPDEDTEKDLQKKLKEGMITVPPAAQAAKGKNDAKSSADE